MTTAITQSDLDELWQAARLFTFPAFCRQETLFKIHAHLSLELAQPVPSREEATVGDCIITWTTGILPDWMQSDEPAATDQGEDPGPVIEVLQTWHPTATGVVYSATQPHREHVRHSPADWREEFAPLDMDKFESDQ